MGLRRLIRAESRSVVTGQDVWGEWWGSAAGTTASGVTMSQATALRVGAVYAAVRLICDATSSLPVDTFKSIEGGQQPYPKPAWIAQPDMYGGTWQSFISQWLVSKLIGHGACIRVLRSDTGSVLAFAVLDPGKLVRQTDSRGRLVVTYAGNRIDPLDLIYDAELIKPGQVMGTSRIDEARETLGLAKALEEFSARFFGNGATTSVVITSPADLTMEQATNLHQMWELGHKGLDNAHRAGVLSGGASVEKTGVDPDEAQMLQSREFAVEEVARLFKIPPAMLQSQKPGSVAYASREQDAIQFVTFTLLPYITAIEAHLSRLLPRGVFVKFNVEGLLRASLADRANAYSVLTQAGVMTDNEARALENLPPKDGGDSIRVPLASISATDADVVAMDKRAVAAARLAVVGYDPADVLAAMGLPAMEHNGLPSVQQQMPQDVAAFKEST